MKKPLSLLLSIILLAGVLVFAGCTQDNTSSQTSAQNASTQETEPAAQSADYALRQKNHMDAKRGVYYEIFVRSFADSDGDGIGDFNGVTAKLDYLKELGVDGLWLMPINPSPSYHGYDVTDYNTVNEDYGTEKDFENLLQEAHARDIKVIMDFVINHTSNKHPWFQASRNADSPYRDYYTWAAKDDQNYDPADRSPWGSEEWHSYGNDYYFAMFWDGMPDLNYENEQVRKEIKNAAKKWLELGVDGFRLDAAMHIYGDNEHKDVDDQLHANLAWWNEFAIACEAVNPEAYLVGEAWQGDEALGEYAQPFDTKFNFAFEETLMHSIRSGSAIYGNQGSIAHYLEEVLDQHYAADLNYIDGVFGTNHDQNRIMSQVFSTEQARLVANIYMTLSGNPYIYYGEEIGMEGEKPDERIREPFKWSGDGSDMDTSWEDNSYNAQTVPLSEQLKDETSMYSYYKKLIALRKSTPALSLGDYCAVETDNNDSIMAYSRSYDGKTVYAVHNFTDQKTSVGVTGIKDGKILFSSDGKGTLEKETVTLQPYGSLLIEK